MFLEKCGVFSRLQNPFFAIVKSVDIG